MVDSPMKAVTLAKFVHWISLSGSLILFKIGLDKHDIKIPNLLVTSLKKKRVTTEVATL
jgi:hypothetical protein